MTRKYSGFHADKFRNSVEQALETIDRILDVHRNPRLAEDVGHSYYDKYGLANKLTNTAIIALMNCLERMGLTLDILKSVDTSKSINLRFEESWRSCVFVEDKNEEVHHVLHTKERSLSSPSVSKVVKRVKEYHWQVTVQWELSVCSGTGTDGVWSKTLQRKSASSKIITQRNKPPLQDLETEIFDVSLDWLLQQINLDSLTSTFYINTHLKSTKTPRRNGQVEKALEFMESFAKWTDRVVGHFDATMVVPFQQHNPAKHGKNEREAIERKFRSIVTTSNVFCPIQPLMDERPSDSRQNNDGAGGKRDVSILSLKADDTPETIKSHLLSNSDIHLFLNEHLRSLEIELASLLTDADDSSEDCDDFLSAAAAKLIFMCRQSGDLMVFYADCINYIEHLLEKQLVDAIGKSVRQDEMDEFFKFHNAKLFCPSPQPFCHTIRQPKYSPVGGLSIERENADGRLDPVYTFSRELTNSIKMPLNASTTLDLAGKVHLHGWFCSHFQENKNQSYKLIARAKPFSSFILIIGTMSDSDLFHPKDAIILQDEDEVLIPLSLTETPALNELRDTINSMSPEQKRFVLTYRAMQLGSSLFGVCAIEIKPQLEKLLGLPIGALAKEIQLTKDLLELFTEYQIPPDMFSFDIYDESVCTAEMVRIVKERVYLFMEGLLNCKRAEVESSQNRAKAAVQSRKGDNKMHRAIDRTLIGRFQKKIEIATRADGTSVRRIKRKYVAPVDSDITPGERNDGQTYKEQAVQLCLGAGRMKPLDSEPSAPVNLMSIPNLVDLAFDKYDKDSAVRLAIINAGGLWQRRRREDLLSRALEDNLETDTIKAETNKAFDLLDAITRSGSIGIEHSMLHVVVSAIHRFDKDVMGTVIQDNICPIEKVEKSTLIFASAVYGIEHTQMVRSSTELERLASHVRELNNRGGFSRCKPTTISRDNPNALYSMKDTNATPIASSSGKKPSHEASPNTSSSVSSPKDEPSYEATSPKTSVSVSKPGEKAGYENSRQKPSDEASHTAPVDNTSKETSETYEDFRGISRATISRDNLNALYSGKDTNATPIAPSSGKKPSHEASPNTSSSVSSPKDEPSYEATSPKTSVSVSKPGEKAGYENSRQKPSDEASHTAPVDNNNMSEEISETYEAMPSSK